MKTELINRFQMRLRLNGGPRVVNPESLKLKIAIIASGRDYQETASWAAPTYVVQGMRAEHVSVLLPGREKTSSFLREQARKYGFRISRFPLRLVSEKKFTSQLKCQGFCAAVSQLASDELLFLVDADTFCLKPINVPTEAASAARCGQIGMAPDIVDRHFTSRRDPWYLEPRQRLPYVNSGVILTGRKALDLFRTFRSLSEQPRFLWGPFNDQKVINYALGKYFRGKLHLLDKSYNGILQHLSTESVIGHSAGGAGYLGTQSRQESHRIICEQILRHAEQRRLNGKWSLNAGRRVAVADANRPNANSGTQKGNLLAAFACAVTNGQMGSRQYRHVAEVIVSNPSCNLLVFGAGYDSGLWHSCARGNVAFVEDDSRYASLAPSNLVPFKFRSRVGKWGRIPALPHAIAKPWDYVLVDGPRGFDEQCPGRQISIAWASKLAQKGIFVHDYERSWERQLCDHYLGEPLQIICDDGNRNRTLAVFRALNKRKRVSLG